MKIPTNLLLRCPTKDAIPIAVTGNKATRRQSTLAWDAVSNEALSRAKPFEAIPGPKGLPLVGNIHRYLPGIGDYSLKKWHETQQIKYKQFGPIIREQLVPGYNMVHLYNPVDMETVSRNEGKFPRRDFFLAMKMMRERNPDVFSTVGVAAGNGPDWYHIRSRAQKVMMRPQIMKMYLPQMNVIADDVIRRIRLLRQSNHQVPMLIDEFFKWALESVTYILFNERMGCLADTITEDSMAQKYIRAVNEFFLSSAKVELSTVPIWRLFPSLSPSYQKLKKVHDFFYGNALNYVQEHINRARSEDDDESDLSLMEMLLRYCSPEDASVMAVDAMAAGIDTTSISVAYVLRNLAANPEAQKKLQDEVDRVLPNSQPLTVQALEKMPYLRACIKESMRIYPVVQGTSRTLDKDIVLSGYRIPASTLMTMNYYVSCKQEANFEDAEKYKPERWLRTASGTPTTADSFAFQPFGFGPRMCIGRRIADLEMLTLITKIMQNFWVENRCQDLEIQFQLVLMIKSPLKYEFYERR